ncbi:aldose 1-epimerase family protein [Clostridium estertheticum]|uniref:Aldose 1-epimerase family protein n=1 Tax=Clostridium estertheticum TaxID=238834 RepID=A0AA47EJS0_9CLOT|nr:aldose 1-epimerase family protein [Clostridium estertheticum]MBU3155986.1 aldose 1-epimerase family protein [Clostridium estertheticum]WAG60679.1 aldose 1-epimerase family protein [Clostridium estertheticum]
MIYFLENSTIKITVSTQGAELHSITGKKEGTQYLWNGDPKYWKYHSPILFPIVGNLVGSKYRIDENIYELPSHGLGRISNFKFIAQTNNSITFELNYSEDTMKRYPYKFSLHINYTIEANTVKVTYTVINLDNKDMSFSIGAHPAFMCPIEKNEKIEDYYLEFNEKETSDRMEITKEGYFSHKRKEALNDTDIMILSKELFKDDALVFDDLKSDKITIRSRNHEKSVSVEFKGFPYMGIWSPKGGAPFLCIEPWFGHADYEDFTGQLKEKEGSILLSIEEEFKYSYKISIVE